MYGFIFPYSLLVVVVLFLFPIQILAQSAPELGGQHDKEAFDFATNVNQQVSINSLAGLCFGSFYPGNLGGSIQVTKQGVRTSTGTVIGLQSDLIPSAAIFEIKCPSNTMINVVVDGRIPLTNQSGNTLTCEPIEINQNSIVSPNNAEAGFLFEIGAKLELNEASQAQSGEYTGQIHVMLIFE